MWGSTESQLRIHFVCPKRFKLRGVFAPTYINVINHNPFLSSNLTVVWKKRQHPDQHSQSAVFQESVDVPTDLGHLSERSRSGFLGGLHLPIVPPFGILNLANYCHRVVIGAHTSLGPEQRCEDIAWALANAAQSVFTAGKKLFNSAVEVLDLKLFERDFSFLSSQFDWIQ